MHYAHVSSGGTETDPEGKHWRKYLVDVDSHLNFIKTLQTKITADSLKNYIITIQKTLKTVKYIILVDENVSTNELQTEYYLNTLDDVNYQLECHRKQNQKAIGKEIVSRDDKRSDFISELKLRPAEYLKKMRELLLEDETYIVQKITFLEEKAKKNETNQERKKTAKAATDAWNQVVQYLASTILVENALRPGVVFNLTCKEFARAKLHEDDQVYVLTAREHNSSAPGTSYLVIPTSRYELYSRYNNLRRVQVVDPESKNIFFTSSRGKRLTSAHVLLQRLNEKMKRVRACRVTPTFLRTMYKEAGSMRGEKLNLVVPRTTKKSLASSLQNISAVKQYLILRSLEI